MRSPDAFAHAAGAEPNDVLGALDKAPSRRFVQLRGWPAGGKGKIVLIQRLERG